MNEEIKAIAQRAEEFHNGKDGFDNKGKHNVYVCQTDRMHRICTVDRDRGVTPFMMVCPVCEVMFKMQGRRRVSFNEGMMQSNCYRPLGMFLMPVVGEWYRPDSLDGLQGGELEHVRNGGLLFRFIEE